MTFLHFRSLLAGLCAAWLTASSAVAQVDRAADDWSVDKRPRPAYDPTGVRFNSFLLFPSVEVGAARDDNIYRQHKEEMEEIEDNIQFVRPRIFSVSQWLNHEIELDVGLDTSFFADESKENITNWFASTAGRLDITRDAWIRADLSLRELHEERGDPDSPLTADDPISRRLLTAGIEGYGDVNRFNFGVKGNVTDIKYEDSVYSITGQRLVQNDRNRKENEISARVGWDIAPGYETYLRATRYDRRYDRPQGEEQYRRNSDGTETVVGLRLNIGVALVADLFFGRRSHSYKDDRLSKLNAESHGGMLTWNATPLTTVRASARRAVRESTLRQASGYLASEFELKVDHELRRNLIIGTETYLTTNKYKGIAREDEIVTAIIRGTWLVSRRTHMDFGYRFQQRDSTVFIDDYDKRVVYLNVRFNL